MFPLPSWFYGQERQGRPAWAAGWPCRWKPGLEKQAGIPGWTAGESPHGRDGCKKGLPPLIHPQSHEDGDILDGITFTLGYGGSAEPWEGVGFGDWGVTFRQPNPPFLLTSWAFAPFKHRRGWRGTLPCRWWSSGAQWVGTHRSEGHRRCHDAAWVFHVPWGISLHPCALGSGWNTGNHGITKAGKAL